MAANPETSSHPASPETSSPAVSLPFRVWLRPDGLEQMEWVPGYNIGAADATAAMAACRAVAAGEKRGLLVDQRTLGVIDREARAIFAAPNDWAYAVAMWVGSPLSMVVANFFLGVSRASVPVRMFTAEADAVAWLHAQRP